MKVLYVEDDFRDADLTERWLRRIAPHIEFETASTIAEAKERLNVLSNEPLDLVLLDMHLIDGDGLSFLRYIRESRYDLAVVVVTGMGDEETAVAALKAKADDYVVKRTGYLTNLPNVLESALDHHKADVARRAHPLNVLYVNDEIASSERVVRYFSTVAEHIHLHVARTTAEVVSVFQAGGKDSGIDILLLVLNQPELNALEILKELRDKHGQDIPVLVLCNEGDEELGRQALKLGAVSYVVRTPGYLAQLPWELEEAHSRAELLRRDAALQESEERFRNVADTAPVFIWSTDFDKQCTYVNRPWLEFTGRTIDQELGAGWLESVHPDDRDHCFDTYTAAFDERKGFRMEYRLRRHDGEYRWVMDSGVPRYTTSGAFVGYIGSVVDITERREAEGSLEKALTELKQLKDRLHEENVYLQEEIRVASNFGEVIGESEALNRVLGLAEQVAPLDTTVLILGETGTGKELLARAIHGNSPRRGRPLVKVNCAALPHELIESELFGHEKGAFTGASTRRAGRFEIANGGTIFLDEIGELPLDLQVKLLRVLQESEFEPVGSSRTVRADVRVIAATNRNLGQAVHDGIFRTDLYYRLSIFPITMPPLRERKNDIPVLTRHFVKELTRKFGKQIDSIPQEVMVALRNCPWPGNIRELRNVIERAVIITHGSKLRLSEGSESAVVEVVPQLIKSEQTSDIKIGSVETLQQSQYNSIVRALKNSYWRIEGPYGAAAALNVHPSKLRAMMKKLGISRPKIKAQGTGT